METSPVLEIPKAPRVEGSEPVKKEPEPSKKEVLDLAVTAISKISGSVTTDIEALSTTLEKLAEKGTRKFLLAFGGTMIAFSVMMKLEVYGVHLARIEPKEFIAMMVLGVFLVLAGTFLDLYGYRREMDVYQESIKVHQMTQNQLADIAKASMATVAEISTSATQEIAKRDSANQIEKPPDWGRETQSQ